MSHPTPKALADRSVRRAREELLIRDHVWRLTEFVRELREERGLGREIPFFDPLDGGVGARCLVVAEAPGPNAVRSGFISRDNPDESAKNTLLAHHEAGIPREATVLWNIVPWYIGAGTRIRPAESADIEQGLPYLFRLLQLLPSLRVVVLAGRKAQRVEEYIRERYPHLEVLSAPHPSPMFVNRDPRNWSRLVDELRKVAESLDGAEIDYPEPRLPAWLKRQLENDRTHEVTRRAQRTDEVEGLGHDATRSGEIAKERWTRIRLADGVELSVRSDVETVNSRAIQELTEFARNRLRQ